MNFIVKPYDPLEEAMQLFLEFNATPPAQRQQTEEELIQLAVHKVKTYDRQES
jgi:hypothetical protein